MTSERDEKADALAGALRRTQGGHLTVFLGAAPGVGKTYAMLTRARDLRRSGLDVVAGVIETHGRAETAALLEGLTVLAPLRIDYRGRTLEELDLDGLIARKPQIALIDELAHRNAPGSRHERRWQDVIELLDAGIDVHTTVNIQHLESLNDIVHRITGIRVSETVPDALFDRLRDIILVDLPPRELLQRLREGKVYLPEHAAQAMQSYFSPSNLVALRELAMQTAADRVDSDLRELHAARGLPGIALRRRVMIAIDGRGQSEYLVRMGRRIAERRDAPWTVVSVQSGRTGDSQRHAEIDRAFALARKLGGDTMLLHGTRIVDTLLEHASRSGASAIVIGRTRERPLARLFNRTLTQQLLQHGAHFELTIVSSPAARARSRRGRREPAIGVDAGELAFSLIATVIAVALAWLVERHLGLEDLSMVFIVAVLVVASRTRMAPAVITAVSCFLAYNFFFFEPAYTLVIAAPQGVATVVLFLCAALVAGRLASQLRMQVVALSAANAHATALQELGRHLTTAGDLGAVTRAGRQALSTAFGVDAWIRVHGSDADPGTSPDAGKDLAAADWSQAHGQPSGRHTDTLAASTWWFMPIADAHGPIGVAGLHIAQSTHGFAAEQRRLAEAMVEDIAQAVVRTRLTGELESARVTGETERLRSALLSSVSHDLRSPLASIIGAADSLAGYADAIAADERHALLETIRLEGERLDRYIQNLLDMTRLGHDGLTLRRDWIGIDELVGSATARLQRYQPGVRFDLQIDAQLPPLHVHPALIEQALFNVLENAAKFSPEGAAIALRVDRVDDLRVRIDVSDRGPGIPDDERARIFDMFYSVERGDRGRTGTGLGLTICQGIIGAHMGSIEAMTGADGIGTTVRITLPIGEPPPDDAAADAD